MQSGDICRSSRETSKAERGGKRGRFKQKAHSNANRLKAKMKGKLTFHGGGKRGKGGRSGGKNSLTSNDVMWDLERKVRES